mgnify:CR=1 FL=1
MPVSEYLFTSESVSEGHPDKVCDLVSDSIVDAFLAEDSNSRVAVETMATTNLTVIAGETRGPDFSSKKIEDVVRNVIRGIGYEQRGFHWCDLRVEVHLHRQSDDIAMGVDAIGNKDEGAGDQGIMFGYACRETDVLMPAPIYFSHEILRSLAQARHAGETLALGPDSKSQVTLRYANGQPVGAASVVVSTQHKPEFDQDQVREIVRPHVEKVLPDGWMCPDKDFYVNPTGRFVIGGPDGDCGLTGRKIIVDTYGGAAPHGGGAFSGKDPTKVDRSAAYVARYLAKNVVAARLAERCTIQLAYAIGLSRPLSVYVDTHGTGEVEESQLSTVLQERVDLSPRGIREHLNLSRPIFARTAAYGHFGRNPDADGGFSWERCDLVEDLRKAF